jgi:hypothetical protein
MLPERTPENLSAQNASCKGASSSSQAIRERRRAQNRISQQCLREKKRLARSDGLQSLDKITEEPTSSGSECNINLTGDAKRHSDLIKDNQELRIALLGMRKKLLSLSTSATTAASRNIASPIQLPY